MVIFGLFIFTVNFTPSLSKLLFYEITRKKKVRTSNGMFLVRIVEDSLIYYIIKIPPRTSRAFRVQAQSFIELFIAKEFKMSIVFVTQCVNKSPNVLF